MNIAGTNTIRASRDRVWEAINDPAVLARTLPGCEQLEVVDADTFRARVTAGVASIRGTYDGTVRLSDRDEPSHLVLHVDGAGAPGTIGAQVQVGLDEVDGGTEVDWDADAIVGGMIGGVGQRMLAGVSTRMAGEFFDALERELVDGPAESSEVASEDGAPADTGRGESGAVPAAGQVFAGRVPAGGGGDDTIRLVGAFVLGAAVALAGVLVGRRGR